MPVIVKEQHTANEKEAERVRIRVVGDNRVLHKAMPMTVGGAFTLNDDIIEQV